MFDSLGFKVMGTTTTDLSEDSETGIGKQTARQEGPPRESKL
jgi:hypothetical protein